MSQTPQSQSRSRAAQKKAQEQAREAQKRQSAAIAERRRLTRKQREQQEQRRFLMIIGAVLGVTLLVLLGGVIYQQAWLPSRPVAQVGSATLTRSGYWQEARLAIAQEIAQNLQLQNLFGGDPQFSQQFAGRSPALNQQVELLQSQPENTEVLNRWLDAQLVEQGSATLGVSVAEDLVNQELTQSYSSFLPATDPLTETAGITETLGADAPPPTPEPAAARDQVAQIVSAVYSGYSSELELTGVEPTLTEEDFRQALLAQQRRQSLQVAVEDALLPEAEFTPSSEPERIEARQILIAVNLPENPSQGVIDEAYDAALADVEAVRERLADGADFATVAAEVSDDPGSAQQGGSVGSFDRDGQSDSGVVFAPEFVEAAFALDEGELSEPVRTQFGWHIIEVTNRSVPAPDQQLATARREAFDAWLEEQRESLNPRILPEPTPSPTVEGGAGELDPDSAPTAVPTFVPGPPTQPPLPEGTAPEGGAPLELELPEGSP